MKKLIIHGCIMVSVLGSVVYAATSNYSESFRDHQVLENIEDQIVTTQEIFDEEELIYQLGLVTKYEERMQDNPQASYLLAESRKMILLALATVDEEKESILEELNDKASETQETEGEEKITDSEISSINRPNASSIVSSISAKDSNDKDEGVDIGNEIVVEDETFTQNESTQTIGLGILDDSLSLPIIDSDVGENSSQQLEPGTSNTDISYTPGELYAQFSDSVDGEISGLCTIYYDQIDEVARRNDFPTSLIIAMRYREHSCIFANPDNGRGNFQITSHFYEPGEITRDEFATQIENYIDFSHAKRQYYDSIQRFGPEPVSLSYDSMDINSIRKHSILYNGVYPDVTLESSWYSNENFTQFRGGRDGIVATVLKVIKWVESR